MFAQAPAAGYPSPGTEDIRSCILRTLIYFDIFRYPLTLDEIRTFAQLRLHSLSPVESVLEELEEAFFIYRFGAYYSLQNDPSLVERRLRGNRMAQDVRAKAEKRSAFIQGFPFVRSVSISGSLSKNYFDETTDFDFFIIAAPHRVWICRMFLTMYKKIFLFNNRKYFCINYYISSDHLCIPDKNLFSAMEIITLQNRAGAPAFSEFMRENAWVQHYFPNFEYHAHGPRQKKPTYRKRLCEWLLSGPLGNFADTASYRLTTFFLRKKYGHIPAAKYRVNLRSEKNVSKHHPQGFQFRVLQAYHEKCRDFELAYAIKLTHA